MEYNVIQLANLENSQLSCMCVAFSLYCYSELLSIVSLRNSVTGLQLRCFLICLWNMAQPWQDVHSLLSSAVVVAGLH